MADQLRIGIVCYATYGGSGVVATELGRELARSGHKVHFISNQIPFRLQQGEFFENVYFHEVTSMVYDAMPARSYGLEMASKIVQIAEDEKLDIIHAHYAVPHAISGIVAKQVLRPRDLKIVTTLHGTDITLVGSAPAYFPLTRWAIQNSDAVTAVSNWLRDETYRTFGDDKPVHVIHNFVDTARFAPGRTCCHRSNFAREGEKIIVHLSNFRPVKRVGDVLRAFAAIRESVPSRLLMIGDGPERDSAIDLARELGVMEATHFLGKQTMIENYFAIADLLIFPSTYESFGIAALEAMSSGVPVVATQGSGLSEVVVDGVTGRLCPVGDVPALAAASVDILSSAETSRRMAEASRKRATCCFESRRVLKLYELLYEDVLAGREPRTPTPCVAELAQ